MIAGIAKFWVLIAILTFGDGSSVALRIDVLFKDKPACVAAMREWLPNMTPEYLARGPSILEKTCVEFSFPPTV